MTVNWKPLTTTTGVDELINLSNEKPQLIFKHSTRCGVSSHMKMQFEAEWKLSDDSIDVYLLDLIAYRSVSNYIAEVSAVYHQSPQVILFKDGGVIINVSHQAIKAATISEALV